MFENIEQQTENKIILLFILEKFGSPITGMYLTDLVLKPGLMNYFSCQMALIDLVENDLVDTTPDSDGIPMYEINDKGREILDSLKNIVPPGILSRYEECIEKEKDDIKRQLEVNASFFQDASGDYYVRCFVRNQGTYIIDIKVPVANKKEADLICRNWHQNTANIYTKILKVMHDG